MNPHKQIEEQLWDLLEIELAPLRKQLGLPLSNPLRSATFGELGLTLRDGLELPLKEYIGKEKE